MIVVYLQGFVDHILVIGKEVRKISQRRRSEPLSADVDMHSAAAVDHPSSMPQVPHNLLQVLNVAVVEDRCHKLDFVIAAGISPGPSSGAKCWNLS